MGERTVTGKPHPGARQTGFSLLGLLFLLAGMGVAMAALGTLWHTASQREKERELLFVGDEFRRAIQRYYEKSPNAAPRYPTSLQELLQDKRYPTVQRYLRKIYRDPMTGTQEWGLVQTPEGGIMGVYSLAKEKPFKQGGFLEKDMPFANRSSYQDWQFVFAPAQQDQRPSLRKPTEKPTK